MEAVVSDILQSRKREPGGLRQTALLSLGAHGAVLGVLALLPSVMPSPAQQPRVVMNISLGGAPGPRTGGTQMIGGTPVVAALPSTAPEIAKPIPIAPQPQPAMTLPDPKQKTRPPSKTAAASTDPKGTAAGRGAETRAGTARVETGAKGEGFGLSSGGGGGTGSRLSVGDFCCPEYITEMTNRVERNWVRQQQATGVVFVKYTIQRNGMLTDIELETSSGNPTLDLASQRAVVNTRTLAPLPAAFTEPTLTVHLEFRYERGLR
ncbi:MAG TPA: energy transducer TonB [Vicinamibacterales bacterium]|nr:energy transducer TonB [Vicinamibacterales bacterium]